MSATLDAKLFATYFERAIGGGARVPTLDVAGKVCRCFFEFCFVALFV
jgi:hypothetical protein